MSQVTVGLSTLLLFALDAEVSKRNKAAGKTVATRETVAAGAIADVLGFFGNVHDDASPASDQAPAAAPAASSKPRKSGGGRPKGSGKKPAADPAVVAAPEPAADQAPASDPGDESK